MKWIIDYKPNDPDRTWDRRRFYCPHCGDWQTYGQTPYCPYCGKPVEENKKEYTYDNT